MIKLKYFQVWIAIAVILASTLIGCHSKSKNPDKGVEQKIDSVKGKLSCCSSNLPVLPFMGPADSIKTNYSSTKQSNHDDMVFIQGGSFLCTDQYCSGFRVVARMKTSWDTSLEHTGFRCVVSSK